MRFLFTACAAAVLLAAPARMVHSAPLQDAKAYFQVRDRASLVSNYTADEIQMQPQKFSGKLLEVRGMITAIAGSETQTTLLLGTEGTPATAVTVTVDKREAYPFLDVGNTVRALCEVLTVEGSANGSLSLRVAVKEHEARSIDEARARQANEEAIRKAAAQRAKPTRPALGSRGISANVYRSAAPAAPTNEAQLIGVYASAVRHFNRRLPVSDAQTIARTIINYSRRYGLDARLVMAVIAVESNFNSNAVSPVGAMGLGQLMPGTAGDLGVGNAFDLRENLEGSTRLLSSHIRNMSSDGRPTDEAIKLALACYNAGAGAVKKYKGIPPYRETQNYVKKITRLYRQMCGME